MAVFGLGGIVSIPQLNSKVCTPTSRCKTTHGFVRPLWLFLKVGLRVLSATFILFKRILAPIKIKFGTSPPPKKSPKYPPPLPKCCLCIFWVILYEEKKTYKQYPPKKSRENILSTCFFLYVFFFFFAPPPPKKNSVFSRALAKSVLPSNDSSYY